MLGTLSNILDILTMAVARWAASRCWWAVWHRHHHDHRGGRAHHEIGLLLALGSRRARSCGLFLGEAVVLAVLGSLLGAGVGFGLAQLIRLFLPALPVIRRCLRAAGGGQQRADRPARRRAAGAPRGAAGSGRIAACGIARISKVPRRDLRQRGLRHRPVGPTEAWVSSLLE